MNSVRSQFLVCVFILGAVGCETEVPVGQIAPAALGPDEALVTPNLNVEDPLIGEFESLTSKVVLFGEKNPDGSPDTVRSLVLTDGDGTTYIVELDENHWPTSFSDEEGNLIEFTYSDTHVAVSLQHINGESTIETVPLADIPDWPPPVLARRKIVDDRSKSAASLDQGPFRFVQVHTKVRMLFEGEVIGVFDKALVRGFVVFDGGPLQVRPTAYSHQHELYSFVHGYQRQDIPDPDQADCERRNQQVETVGRVATHAGTALAILGGGCKLFSIFTGQVEGVLVCDRLQHGLTILAGVGISGASSVATEVSLRTDCERAPTKAQPCCGEVTVGVNPRLPGLPARTQSRFVNFNELPDPHRVEFVFDYEVEPQVTRIATNPPVPTAGNPYSIVFNVFPPDASVAWSVTGNDGFTSSGVADAENGEATSTQIPGGASNEVQDVLTGQVMINGVRAGPVKDTSFHFSG